MQQFFDLKGKTAIVTGGSSGIGFMISRGLIEIGVKVYITGRKLEQLETAADALNKYANDQGGSCAGIQSDLSTMDGINGFVTAFQEKETSLDILINNAGASWGAPMEDFPESGWDKVMDINVKSVFFLTQKLIPMLREAAKKNGDKSRVVNIASINGITHPLMQTYSYSSSKAAVIQLTRHMATELAPQSINMNGIAPGFFPSKMTKHIQGDEMEKALRAKIPTGDLGEYQDVAGTAIYLCSRAANYVCGHTVVLDGGMVAQAG